MLKEILELLENKEYIKLKKIINEINDVDLAEILGELDKSDLVRVFRLIGKDKAVDVFAELDVDIASTLLNLLGDKEAVSLIDEMPADDATDILEEMPANLVDKILKGVSAETRKDINRLLKYEDSSAGSIMTVEYAELKSELTVSEAIEVLRNEIEEYETVDICFVVDPKRKIIGKISLKDLLFSSKKSKIIDICDKELHYVDTATDQEEVANIFQKYDLNVLPVVDSEKRLVGIITIDDVVDVIESEATEDMKKMAAIIPIDKPYDKMGIFETFKARIPWLLLLMVSATFTGKIIQGFESQLASQAILTAFIPMLMDTGGNAGGQSSVSIIRALSLNDIEFKDIFKVAFKEVRVAILCSVVLALCNFIKMITIDGVSNMIALTVCLTLILTIIIAKTIGCMLPMVAKRLGFDPAVMASPFITTIVDACSLVIYFSLATLILGL